MKFTFAAALLASCVMVSPAMAVSVSNVSDFKLTQLQAKPKVPAGPGGPIHCGNNGCWEGIRPWFAQPSIKFDVTYSAKPKSTPRDPNVTLNGQIIIRPWYSQQVVSVTYLPTDSSIR